MVLGKGKRTSRGCELPKRQGQQEVTSLSGPQGIRRGPKLPSPEKAGLSRKANIAGGLRESSHFENHRGAEQTQEESRREEIPKPPSHPVFPSAVRAFHWPATPNPPIGARALPSSLPDTEQGTEAQRGEDWGRGRQMECSLILLCKLPLSFHRHKNM